MTLARFPRRTLRGDQVVHRIHRSDVAPWWFSSDGSGRFDPVGTGQGACYVAESPLDAWIEVFRKQMLLAEAEVRQRSLLSVALGRTRRLADLTSRRALAFGVTASLGADERYEASRAFAVEAVGSGFDGIRYLLRHDPAQQHYGIAVFADAGLREPGDPLWPASVDAAVPDVLVSEAERRFGYRVMPTP